MKVQLGGIEKLLSEYCKKRQGTNYVRIAAFMGLFGFIDEPGVLDLGKRNLCAGERPPLAKRYEEMFLSQYLDEK
jgi:aminopeptidase N